MAETTRTLLAPCRDCADRDTCVTRPDMERAAWRFSQSLVTRLFAAWCLLERPGCGTQYDLRITCARWRSRPMTIVPVMQAVQRDAPQTA